VFLLPTTIRKKQEEGPHKGGNRDLVLFREEEKEK
jgi:hypothetical protein